MSHDLYDPYDLCVVVYTLISRRRFQQMEVLEGQNILVTISGKKNKIRVYYLSWLNNKIFKKDQVSVLLPPIVGLLWALITSSNHWSVVSIDNFLQSLVCCEHFLASSNCWSVAVIFLLSPIVGLLWAFSCFLQLLVCCEHFLAFFNCGLLRAFDWFCQ